MAILSFSMWTNNIKITTFCG